MNKFLKNIIYKYIQEEIEKPNWLKYFFLEETNNFPGLRAGGENELQRKGRAYLDSYFEKLSMDRKC